MKLLLSIALLLSFAAVPATAHNNDDTFNVLRARKFFAIKSRHTLSVSVPADKLNSEFTLTIKNGKNIRLQDCGKFRHHFQQRWCESINEWKSRLQKFTRVDGAYVLINGETVVSPQTLNKNIEDLEIPISLDASNQIEIQLSGHRHSFIELSIKGSKITNAIPVASAETTSGEVQFFTDVPVEFDASSSSDSDGTIVEYRWDFGDGSTEVTATPTISHIYDFVGDYTVSLVVVDDQGAESLPVELEISIKQPAPLIADFQTTPSVLEGPAPFSFDAVSTSTSPDTTIVSTTWFLSGDNVILSGDSISYTYNTPGNYFMQLTVQDELGRSSTKSVTIVVTP